MSDSHTFIISDCSVVVDAEDAHLMGEYTWFVANGYVRAALPRGNGKQIALHNLIMQPPAGLEVDHKDLNPLNNTRANLRICTRSQNTANRRKFQGKSSAYKGVSLHKGTGKWQVIFTYQNKQRHVGLFETELAAARAYDAEALRLYGEFARPNQA
jgi:hypothetical protein